jgi:hypothetical protein
MFDIMPSIVCSGDIWREELAVRNRVNQDFREKIEILLGLGILLVELDPADSPIGRFRPQVAGPCRGIDEKGIAERGLFFGGRLSGQWAGQPGNEANRTAEGKREANGTQSHGTHRKREGHNERNGRAARPLASYSI